MMQCPSPHMGAALHRERHGQTKEGKAAACFLCLVQAQGATQTPSTDAVGNLLPLSLERFPKNALASGYVALPHAILHLLGVAMPPTQLHRQNESSASLPQS